MKSLVIAAHPDDETIWVGGLMLQHPEWDWTVLSLCRRDDTDRAPKFRAVCERLGANAIISDLDDGNPPEPINTAKEIGTRITELLGDSLWDICLTHGPNGEYDHPRHKQVHFEVLRLVEKEAVRCRRLWTFAYVCDSGSGRCVPADWADEFVELSKAQLDEKRRIVREEYGYGANSFEVKACISPECFRKMISIQKG